MKAIIDKIRVWGFAGILNFVKAKYGNAVQRRRLTVLARRSQVKEPERGVTVIGELTGRVSLSKALRDFVLNMKDAGIPCQAYDTLLKPQIPPADTEGMVSVVTRYAQCYLPLSELVDLDKERARLTKELEKNRGFLENQRKKLANESFVSRAPEHVVNAERERAEKLEALIANLEESLRKLG